MKDQSRYARRYMHDSEIEDAIKMFSRRLSNINHSFITSVSTRDIVELVTEQFANNSEHTNKLHIELSEYIEDKINKYSKLDDSKVEDAKDVLSDIQSQLRGISGKREQLLKPFTLLSKLVEQIFQHKGIQLTENITLGETKESMFSDRLSAGEKQMLSFICYNSFYEHGVIFIDEPEISLHVDWQRILFPTLLSQSTNNQFIIATHSPFIYSKYTDKEILLSEDRGGY